MIQAILTEAKGNGSWHELAHKLGYAEQTIRKWYYRKRKPSDFALEAINQIIGFKAYCSHENKNLYFGSNLPAKWPRNERKRGRNGKY